MKLKNLLLAGLIPVAFANASQASVSSVSGADVKEGVGKIVLRTAFAEDETKTGDNSLYTRYGVSYGFTGYFGIELVANQLNRPGDSYEHENASFRLNFQYLEDEVDGFDAAVRLTYDLTDNDKGNDEFELRFMNSYKPDSEYELRNNIILEHDIGPAGEPGIQLETRWQATKKFDIGREKPLKIGVEMFNDFKNLRNIDDEWDQGHEIGPVVSVYLTDDITFQTGILQGLGDDSPRTSWRLFLYHKF